MAPEQSDPPKGISPQTDTIAAGVAEKEFTVVTVTPLDDKGNPVQDETQIYDPYEIGVHGELPDTG